MGMDVNKWLTEDMGFTADEAKAMLPSFTPERIAKLESGYSRQSDYSRSMNELKKAQDEHAAAVARINNEYLEWGKIAAGDKAAQDALRTDIEKSQVRIVQLTNRLTQLAQATGQDPTKILGDLEPIKPVEKPAAVDLTGYVKSDDVNRQIGQLANMALDVPAILDDLRDEHKDLFGKNLKTSEIIAEIRTRSTTPGNQKSLDPRQVWEELHGVPAKRQAVEQARIDKLVADAEARGAEAARSQMQIPGSHAVPGKTPSPLFREQRTSTLKRPQPESSVMAAAGAFRSGKYRKQGAGGPAGT